MRKQFLRRISEFLYRFEYAVVAAEIRYPALAGDASSAEEYDLSAFLDNLFQSLDLFVKAFHFRLRSAEKTRLLCYCYYTIFS